MQNFHFNDGLWLYDGEFLIYFVKWQRLVTLPSSQNYQSENGLHFNTGKLILAIL